MTHSSQNGADLVDIDESDVLARLIYEVLQEIAWQADAKTVTQRVRRLHLGLPAEDEFSVLLAWLGKCCLVHKLDQLQTPPEAKGRYEVPDLLAVFEYEGRMLPVLIEVKAKRAKKLSWKANYYEGLKRYGRTLELPVLVAWKRGQIWSLFDLEHFSLARTNYSIPFQTAHKQNLLGILADDFVIVLRGGVGFHLVARKEERVSVDQLADGYRESWQTRIEQAYFESSDGAHLRKLGPGLWSLFLTSGVEETSYITDSGISLDFKVPQEEPMQWAHTVFSNLLELRGKDESFVHWRHVLQKYAVPTKLAVLRKGAEEGIDAKIVRYVIDQQPQELPKFLRSVQSEVRSDEAPSTLRREPIEYEDPFDEVAEDERGSID